MPRVGTHRRDEGEAIGLFIQVLAAAQVGRRDRLQSGIVNLERFGNRRQIRPELGFAGDPTASGRETAAYFVRPRRRDAEASLEHARIIIASDAQEAVAISNRYAPEHLIVHTQNARELLASIRNAGSVFLGPWSPESVGDYASGTNHVLPTYGAARSYSGLSVEQFMRHMTVQELTRDGLAAIGDTVIALAGLEGLDAHAEAVRCRLSREPGATS